jgi:hypothetical protein
MGNNYRCSCCNSLVRGRESDVMQSCPSYSHTHYTVLISFDLTMPTVGYKDEVYLTAKNAVFWDVALCGSCVNWRFGGTYRIMTHVHAVYSLADFSIPKMGAIISSETSFHTRSTWRHIPEVTAVKTSNLTFLTTSLRPRNLCKLVAMARTVWRQGGRSGISDISLFHVIQTDSGAQPASCPMGTGASSPGV